MYQITHKFTHAEKSHIHFSSANIIRNGACLTTPLTWQKSSSAAKLIQREPLQEPEMAPIQELEMAIIQEPEMALRQEPEMAIIQEMETAQIQEPEMAPIQEPEMPIIQELEMALIQEPETEGPGHNRKCVSTCNTNISPVCDTHNITHRNPCIARCL